jgi:hypothetical protein
MSFLVLSVVLLLALWWLLGLAQSASRRVEEAEEAIRSAEEAVRRDVGDQVQRWAA